MTPRRILVVPVAALFVLGACSSSKSSSSSSTAQTSAPANTKTLGDDPGNQSAGTPQSAAYTPTGTLIADNGFRPDKNGFPFENYGDKPARTNLTPDDVRAIFGDAVCSNTAGGSCDLIPEANAWMNSINGAMGGGHCYGFSVAAELLFEGKIAPDAFGAPAISGLGIDNNAPLQRQLAVDWAFQTLDSVRAAQITGTPNDILAKLKDALVPNPPDTYTIAIFRRDGNGGHAVTPYAIEDKGAGIENVLIYDNNWPGVTREITFDTNKNTWNYVAATNPNEPSEVYEGDASTNSISLFPTSPGLGTQPCPFCQKVAAAGGGSALGTKPGVHLVAAQEGEIDIYLDASDTDHGHLLITDATGHRLGYDHGTFVNEIPGGRVDRSTSSQNWKDSIEPEYFVPGGGKYTIVLDGSQLNTADNETVGAIGPNFDLSASDIDLNPGEKDTLTLAPEGTSFSYTAGRSQTPALELAVSDDTADYTFDVSGDTDAESDTVTLGLPTSGGVLNIDTGTTPGSSTIDLSMTREDDQGSQRFDHKGLDLDNSDTAQLQFGKWANGQSIPLVVTTADGQTSTEQLTDQS